VAYRQYRRRPKRVMDYPDTQPMVRA
jgi:hypothetical protein